MAEIMNTAVTDGSFCSLVAAIKAANLIDTLKDIDSFIPCASTDLAFAQLPASTIETLLNNINHLEKILTYHMISGKVIPIKPIEPSSLFNSIKVDYGSQPEHPMLMITVSSTSLLIPQ